MLQCQWRSDSQGGGETGEHHGHDAGQEEERPFQRHDRGGGASENTARPLGAWPRHHHCTWHLPILFSLF